MEAIILTGQVVSIVILTNIIIAYAKLVLEMNMSASLVGKALLLAVLCILPSALLVVYLHLPVSVMFSTLGITLLVLSYYVLKPIPKKLVVYWLLTVVTYIVIQLILTLLFDWTFMLPLYKG